MAKVEYPFIALCAAQFSLVNVHVWLPGFKIMQAYILQSKLVFAGLVCKFLEVAQFLL